MKLINFPPRGELKEAETRCDDILPAELRGAAAAAAAAGPRHAMALHFQNAVCRQTILDPESWLIRAFILS